MSSLKEIKNRIGSVKNTQQITKAMKMVSASKLRKAQSQVEDARYYSSKLKETILLLVGGLDSSDNPLMTERPGGKAAVLLITSDKGLCGGLNTNLCRQVTSMIKDNQAGHSEFELYCLGKKGRDYFVRRGFKVAGQYVDQKDQKKTQLSVSITQELVEKYISGEINSLYIAYSSFKSVISNEPQVSKVLPMNVSSEDIELNRPDFIFEPRQEIILETLIPRYIENMAYISSLEHIASEHGSRMSTMDAATRNAGEMISKLKLFYNRARQAAITTELTEIISGAESIQ